MPLLLADNFLAGSLLSLLLPALLLVAVALWFAYSYRHIYDDIPESSAALPSAEVLDAAVEAGIETAEPHAPPDAAP
ncbi:MAG TPA: hypothetical protein VFN55_12830 [Solirubrobacteraceae bacterium]|nr:hypothetical protein [Solirubrobacteraceae bacterium]